MHGNIFQPIKYGESMIIYQHTGLNNGGNHINFMHIFWIEFTVRLLYSQGHRQSWPFRLQKSNNYSCLRKFVVTHTRKKKNMDQKQPILQPTDMIFWTAEESRFREKSVRVNDGGKKTQTLVTFLTCNTIALFSKIILLFLISRVSP